MRYDLAVINPELLQDKLMARRWHLLPGWLLLPAVLLAALMTAPQTPANDDALRLPPRHAILIGWDGAQRAHVHEMLERGKLPNLASLAARGALVDIDIGEKTDTKAGWSQILTGYSAGVTGVHSNSEYQPIPYGYSIFERLKDHLGADTFATVFIAGKDRHVGNAEPALYELDEFGLPVGIAQVKRARQLLRNGRHQMLNGQDWLYLPGEPYYYVQHACDVYEIGLVKDDAVGERAQELLESYRDTPFFFFIHFAEVDHSGHQHGENSAEYEAALQSADRWLGCIEDKLTALGLADETLIMVTADHGVEEGLKTHTDAPFVFLGTNDPSIKRNGMRQDIVPTILDRFDVDVNGFFPPLDGAALGD